MIRKKTDRELEQYLKEGKKFGKILESLRHHLSVGAIKDGLEAELFFKKLLADHDLEPCFGEQKNEEGEEFGRAICCSVNNVVAHGRPTSKRFKAGNWVSIDCGAKFRSAENLRYLHLDSAFTIRIGYEKQGMARAPLKALKDVLEYQPKDTYEISKIIDAVRAEKNMKSVVALTGHGIGYKLHESPAVHNMPVERGVQKLINGSAFCVEPMFVEGEAEEQEIEHVFMESDSWTIKTESGAQAAHWETTFIKKYDKIIDVVGITNW